LKLIFWLSLFLVTYTYLLYAVLIWIWMRLRGQKPTIPDSTFQPKVSILVACYNEASFIRQKLDNLLNIEYPEAQLEIVFVTDGSTDETVTLAASFAREHSQVSHYHSDERRGKQHAVDRVIPLLKGDIVVFNDCNTLVNKQALQKIVRHFANHKVGVVTGEKKILVKERDQVVSSGEGLYWKYESFLKRMDAAFYSAVGSPGELFAIRRSLYGPVPSDISIEDFYLSVQIVLKGYLNIYEPEAYAGELASLSLTDEFKRKRRIATGAFRTVFRLREIYSLKHLRFLFLYISHRVMRWTAAPVALLSLLVSSVLAQGVIYELFFWLQIAFYALALIGWLTSRFKTRMKLFYIPFYFVFMNTALAFGFFDFLRKRNNVVWEKVNRRLS